MRIFIYIGKTFEKLELQEQSLVFEKGQTIFLQNNSETEEYIVNGIETVLVKAGNNLDVVQNIFLTKNVS